MEKPREPQSSEKTEKSKNKVSLRTIIRRIALPVTGAGLAASLGGAIFSTYSAIRADAQADTYAETGQAENAQKYKGFSGIQIRTATALGVTTVCLGVATAGLLEANRTERRRGDGPHSQATSATSVPTGPPPPKA